MSKIHLIRLHSQRVPKSSLVRGGLTGPRGEIFPGGGTNLNRRDAPRQAPYFLSRRRQKVSKKRLPLRGACGRDGAVLPTTLGAIQLLSGSVAIIASPITELSPAYLPSAPFCVVRGSGGLKTFKTKQRRRSLRIAACRDNHYHAQMEQTKTRRPSASPLSGHRPKPPRPHAGGSPDSFGYFSKPN